MARSHAGSVAVFTLEMLATDTERSTDALHDAIREHVDRRSENGLSIREIADAAHVSVTTVHRLRRDA